MLGETEDMLMREWEEWLEEVPAPNDPERLWQLNCMYYAGKGHNSPKQPVK